MVNATRVNCSWWKEILGVIFFFERQLEIRSFYSRCSSEQSKCKLTITVTIWRQPPEKEGGHNNRTMMQHETRQNCSNRKRITINPFFRNKKRVLEAVSC